MDDRKQIIEHLKKIEQDNAVDFLLNLSRHVIKKTAQDIYNYLKQSGVLNVAPDTIKMFFKENYGVED